MNQPFHPALTDATPQTPTQMAGLGGAEGVFAAMSEQRIRLQSSIVLLLGLGLFLAMPFVLSIGAVVFLPPVTAMIFAIVLSPLADLLTRFGLPAMVA